MTDQTATQTEQPRNSSEPAPSSWKSHRFDSVALVLGGLALVALAFYVQSILNPFSILAVVYIILTPFREYRAARKIMLSALVLFLLWFFYTLSGLLVPFILGMVLAYLFNPVVGRLHDRGHLHRTWSSLIITLLFCGALVTIGWIFLPSLVDQTKEFFSRLSDFARQNANSFDQRHLRHLLVQIGFPTAISDQIVRTQAGPQLEKLVTVVPRLVMWGVEGLPKFLERTLNMIIVPIAMFYFLKDWSKIGPLLNDLFPPKNQHRRDHLVRKIDSVLYGYVRGQATVAIIVGILGAIAYSILGIPYAGLLGVTLAIADLIPIVGMILSAFVVELVIVLTMVLNVGVIASGIIVIGCLHLLEIYIISPRLVGQHIGIPPILMILALLVFGYFLGFVGLLIAVPVTGILMIFVEEYRESRRSETA